MLALPTATHRTARAPRTALSLAASLALRTAIAAAMTQAAMAAPVHNVPKIVELGVDSGAVAPTLEETLTVVLKLPEQAAFDRAVDALYEPGSANYHRWLTPADLQDYAPTAADFAAVQAALVRQGLRVVSADPQRFSVRVRGSVDTIQKAFQTELHTVVYRGTAYQAHIRDARLADPAAALIAAVAGIDRQRVTPQAKLATNPITGKALFPRRVLKTAPAATLPGEITDVALSATSQFAYTTPGAALPTASYSGTV